MAAPDDPDSLPTQAGTGSPDPGPLANQRQLSDSEIEGLLGARSPMTRGGWQPPPPEELQTKLPQYEITELVGRGGMGAVYKGWQKSLDRFVAIKILPPGLESGDVDFAGRFKREAKSMARLKHPGIIPVFDAGETTDGLLYFVMDYVDGTDVQKMLADRGHLPVEEALGITTHVLAALAYAHEHGIIHRDIKPANIMVDAAGRVHVADFGLARSTAVDSTMLTGSHMVMGTPDFMAPETQLGMQQVDHRADLYAVGVMLYRMLTGKLPRGRFDPPSRAVPGLDKRLDRIMDRALQPERDARYSSAAELRTELEPILTRALARRAAVVGSTVRNRLPLWIGGTAVLLALAGAAIYFGTPKPQHPVAPSLPGTTSVPSSDPGWQPLRNEEQWRSGGTGREFVEGRVHLFGGGIFQPQLSADGAIRARLQYREGTVPTIHLRSVKGQGRYIASLFGQGWNRCQLQYHPEAPGADSKSKMLGEVSLPRVLQPGESALLELRAQGDHLTVLVDDAVVIEARDGTLREAGQWGIFAEDGWFESVEVQALAAPASATLGASNLGEVKTFAGHRYQLVSQVATWEQAKAKAEAMGGHLATVTSQAEHDWILATYGERITSPQTWFWLGGFAPVKDQWSLVTGESLDSVPWTPGHPKYRGSDGYPAAMGFQWCEKGNRIVAQGAEHKLPFLIEWVPPLGSAESWKNVTHDPTKLVFSGAAERTPEGLRFTGYGSAMIRSGEGPQRDGAVRMRTSFGGLRPLLRVRGSRSSGNYQLLVKDTASVVLDRWDETIQRSTALCTFSLPTALKLGEDAEFELRVVGQTITVKFNGEILGTVTDAAFSNGEFGVGVTDRKEGQPVLLKSLEILDLDASNGANAASATASKDRPFVNSLGMKFVPVPIIGGPSDGKRMLFCVWDTRVRDYEVFVKETGREWSKASDVEQGAEHPAVNVSWEDATAFCAWLTEQERKVGRLAVKEVYRLPTDHEWSCAVGSGNWRTRGSCRWRRPRRSRTSFRGGRRGHRRRTLAIIGARSCARCWRGITPGSKVEVSRPITGMALRRRRRWVHLRRTALGCTILAATLWNGARIGTTATKRARCRAVLRGLTAAASICCRQTVSATSRKLATTVSVSVVWWVCPRRERPRCLRVGRGRGSLGAMSFTAVVENDTVKLPPGVHLPDGTEVTIVPAEQPDEGQPPILYEVFKKFIGKAEGLPADFAAEHDH